MKQKTIHLSFTKYDDDLFTELMRHSARNYVSASNQANMDEKSNRARKQQSIII
jgi:hypothetical protein